MPWLGLPDRNAADVHSGTLGQPAILPRLVRSTHSFEVLISVSHTSALHVLWLDSERQRRLAASRLSIWGLRIPGERLHFARSAFHSATQLSARYAMNDNENFRQPTVASRQVTNYLDMTTPRRSTPRRRPRRRDEDERNTRAPIDNRGLSLEEGNDFA